MVTHVFSARHGHDEKRRVGGVEDYFLSPKGEEQIVQLSSAINEICPGRKLIIGAGKLEKHAARVGGSVDILKRELGVSPEDVSYSIYLTDDQKDVGMSYEEFWDTLVTGRPHNYLSALPEEVEGIEGIVLLSHRGIAEVFSKLYMQQNQWEDAGFEGWLKNGQAVCMNNIEKKWRII